MPVDLKIDTLTGDLVIADRDLVLVSEADELIQHLYIKFRKFLGEWFLDNTTGVPWRQRILGKARDPRDLESVFKIATLEPPEVLRITGFSLDYIANVRRLVPDIKADTIFGPIQLTEPIIP